MAAGATLDTEDDQDAIDNVQPPAMTLPTAPPAAQASAGGTAPGSAAPASPTPALAPATAATNGIEGQPQKKQIPTGPKVEFDPKKLAKVQTPEDLVDAMRPKSRTDYLDWWEKTHGDIDEKYDNLQKQLGQRPEDEGLTRSEKFAALLQFGLHLMKNSSTPTPNQGSVLTGTLSDEYDAMQKAHQDNVAAQQKDYDTQANAIEQGRQAALKGIGTPAQAMAGQQASDKAYAQETKDNAAALKSAKDVLTDKQSALGPVTYSTDPKGNLVSLVRDPKTGATTAEPVLTIDGKPYQGKVLGRETGSGVEKGDPAAVKTQKYLMSLGYTESDATNIAMKPKTNNPNADWISVYKSAIQANGGDDASAKHVADIAILNNYGAGALAQVNKPLVPSSGKYAPPQPPDSVVQGMKPGMVYDFGDKGKWMKGLDGKPVLVSRPGGRTVLNNRNAIQNPDAALPTGGLPAPNASP
jgi:hypothetical protein